MPRQRANMPQVPMLLVGGIGMGGVTYNATSRRANKSSRAARQMGAASIHKAAAREQRAAESAASATGNEHAARQHREAATRHDTAQRLTRGQRALAASVYEDAHAGEMDPGRRHERSVAKHSGLARDLGAKHAKRPGSEIGMPHKAAPHPEAPARPAKGAGSRSKGAVQQGKKGGKYILLPGGRKRYIK